jgi:hypothetical protein
MDRKRALAAAAVVVVAGGIVVYAFARRQPQGAASSGAAQGEAEGVNFRLAPVNAAYQASEGATPCETAYNAFRAMEDVAKGRGSSLPFGALPPKETFVARCAKLPEQEQLCFQPRYQAQHHDICDPVAKRYEKKNPMFSD